MYQINKNIISRIFINAVVGYYILIGKKKARCPVLKGNR